MRQYYKNYADNLVSHYTKDLVGDILKGVTSGTGGYTSYGAEERTSVGGS